MNLIILSCVSGKLFQRNIGPYQLAFFLRQNNISTQVIDFTDSFEDEELFLTTSSFIDESTVALGISTTFYSSNNENFVDNERNYSLNLPQNILFCIEKIKKNYPKIKIILGGARSNWEYEHLVDKVFSGYAEDEVLQFMLQQKQLNNDLENKFNIEHLEHRFTKSDCITHNEVLPIEISRGCIFKCKFCAYPLNGKNKNDYIRDAKKVTDEMKYNFDNFGTTNYFFVDDTFNDNNFKLEKLHDEISKLPFKINFTCYLRLDLLYRFRHQIGLLSSMGLSTPFFGIESLNQKTCTAIGKGLNTEIVKNFLLELYHDIWKENIPFYLSFIIGLPFETKESINDCYEWVKKTKFTPSFQPLSIFSNSVYKSDIELNYFKYGYKIDKHTKWYNNNFTQDEATELATNYNESLMFSNSLPASWFYMTLMNHGYTKETLKGKLNFDLNWDFIIKEKTKRLYRYKKLLKSKNF